jgi:hypothetical protein
LISQYGLVVVSLLSRSATWTVVSKTHR